MSSFLPKEANVVGLDDIHLDMEGVKEVDIQDHSVDSDENMVLLDDIASLIRSDIEETRVCPTARRAIFVPLSFLEEILRFEVLRCSSRL
ncbi:hypothetical protein HN51_059452, partial [Arachis hypogaea]